MAIRTGSDQATRQATVSFTIADTDGAVVSVVGSFNDWTPGLHPLESTNEGTLTVTLLVQPGEDVHFRYLDSNGVWFDDPDSDTITEHGSVISAARLTADAVPVTGSDAGTPAPKTTAAPGSAPSDVSPARAQRQTRRATKRNA